jgi:hypothetical protein
MNFWSKVTGMAPVGFQVVNGVNYPLRLGKISLWLIFNITSQGDAKRPVHLAVNVVELTVWTFLRNILQDLAFVIDGWALEMALTFNYKAFTELAMLSKTAICCRVTPSQKAQVFFITSRRFELTRIWKIFNYDKARVTGL